MNKLKESGHYSIAGFVYQVLGSGFEAFHICEKIDNEATPDSLLIVERFGQDAVEQPPTESGKKPRLIQYKYSTVGETITEGALCDVLFAFVRSARNTSTAVDGFEYELITNRDLAAKAAAWFENDGGQDKAETYLQGWAEKYVDGEEKRRAEQAKNSKSKKTHKPTKPEALAAQKAELCADLLAVFDAFKYCKKTKAEFEQSLRDVAKQYGMLEEEFATGVDGVVSHIIQISGSAGPRVILPRNLRSKLTGNGDAVKLRANESLEKQQADLDQFNSSEVPLPVISRPYDQDLFDSVLTYPLTIVYGDGGCGKSVALSDLVSTCLNDRERPPAFCLLERAMRFTPELVVRRVAGWRNFSTPGPGETFEQSYRRLEGAYSDRPVLLVCIDAIDEKDSQMLPSDCVDFVVKLVKDAVKSRIEDSTGTPLLSLVLSCRNKGEHKNLTRTLEEIAPEADINYVKVSDFGDDELVSAIKNFDGVGDDIGQRLGAYLGIDDFLDARTRNEPPSTVSHQSVKVIRHPVLWYIFSKLKNVEQHECLDGSPNGLNRLGDKYLEWFQKKAFYRIRDLQLDECRAALHSAAVAVGDPAKSADYSNEWVLPTTTAGDLDKRRARLLYDEAISAGIIAPVEEQGRTWRWKQEWFCTYLLTTAGVAQ